MKVKVMCRKLVKIYIIRPKPGPVAARNRTRVLWITRPVLYHRATEAVADNLGVAFFATGPGLGLIMYILTTLEFLTHIFV